MLEDIGSYTAAARGKTAAEFLTEFPHPVFVVATFAEGEETGTWTRIRVGEPVGDESIAPPFRVAQIKKREGANRFSMITLGRSKTNDIRVPAGEISKVHAYLTQEDGEVRIVDAGSTNGTLVRGLRLEPKEDKVKLTSGDDLTLGVIAMTYYDAQGFYDFLRSLSDSGNG